MRPPPRIRLHANQSLPPCGARVLLRSATRHEHPIGLLRLIEHVAFLLPADLRGAGRAGRGSAATLARRTGFQLDAA
jgi:hypothetical protein